MKQEFVFGLEQASWPALLLDGEGRVLRTNEAAVDLFGAVLEGNGPRLAAIWSSENRMSAEQFIAQWLRSPSAIRPLKMLVRSGGTQSLSIHLCSTTVQEQKRVLLQVPPVSQSLELEAQAQSQISNAVKEAHKQKLECALQLARTVALDFNNALTGILGHTSYLLSQLGSDSPWRRSLAEIEKSAAKAAEIAYDLGTFSNQDPSDQGQAPGNLNRVVQMAMDLFRSGLPGSHLPTIRWECQWESHLHAARFNEAQLQQAFVRILENAVESVEPSGRITVATRNLESVSPVEDGDLALPPGQYVCVEIADDGIGIPPQVLPRIFEPFFTTKSGQAHRGLGLAWVYGIVTNHRGGVTVRSQPKLGTLVRVYLPAEGHVVQDSVVDPADLRGNATVLIVDDEDLLLTMGETILTAYGYKVLIANHGGQALEVLRSQAPVDLVITDLVMPQMGGRELVEQICQLAPQTRILCTSGYVHPAGPPVGDHYLQKPFSCQELLRRVKQILNEDGT